MNAGSEPVVLGLGVLRFANGVILLSPARYRLRVRAEGEEAWRPIDGNVLNPPAPQGFPLSAIGADVVLQLADGRQWRCVLLTHRGELTTTP